jgi:hypothetical protein
VNTLGVAPVGPVVPVTVRVPSPGSAIRSPTAPSRRSTTTSAGPAGARPASSRYGASAAAAHGCSSTGTGRPDRSTWAGTAASVTAVPTSGSAAIRPGSATGSRPRPSSGVPSASRSSPEPSITCTEVVATRTGAAAYRATVPW